MLKKLPFIIPLLALIALLVWWFTPHYTAYEEAYYRAVFCMIDHDDSRQFLHDMQNIVEGRNSDYALGEDRQRCGEILREKQQGKSS